MICELGHCSCAKCGESFNYPLFEGGPAYPDPQSLEVDHVIPLRDGGDDSPSNLQLLCKSCHCEKTVAENKARRIRILEENNLQLFEGEEAS